MRTLIIRNSEWLRGTGNDKGNLEGISSGLLVNGRRCCLGLDARDMGLSDEIAAKCGTPESAAEMVLGRNFGNHPLSHWTRFIEDYYDDVNEEHNSFWTDTNEAGKAMAVNDNPDTTDEQKIALLRPLFREVGVEIDWRPNE